MTQSEQFQISKIIERGKVDTSNTQIYDRSHSWLGTDISIKRGEGFMGPNLPYW